MVREKARVRHTDIVIRTARRAEAVHWGRKIEGLRRGRHRRYDEPERRPPWRESSLRKFERKSVNCALIIIVRRNGAQGRSRTDTLLTAVDFPATSALAVAVYATFVVRSTLFTVVLRATVGAHRCSLHRRTVFRAGSSRWGLTMVTCTTPLV